ncbi:PREDICTED: uncharacterized protein LOC106805778 isoform X1 [Priapulus caudatus]|uniref:Uncharacterized protein LOC106805778 isoform X1 n=1 Tax=Priapulus caudatus TaxID=37621 RepID=A0ABM1DSR4_PRICU|nr:PREDICTED: uncharacterized protein LOC106805778 isoform X1 [Priapulus caudatus]
MSKTDLVSANLETSPDSTRKCAHIEPIDMGNGRHDDDDGGCHDGGQQGTPGALAARCTQLPDLVQGQQQQQRRWTASSDEMQRQIAEHLRMVGDEIDRSYSMPNLLEGNDAMNRNGRGNGGFRQRNRRTMSESVQQRYPGADDTQ